MADLFKIEIVHSESHLVFPKIIIGILIILLIVMLIQGFLKAKRENRPIFSFKNKRFFEENYDKLKIFGSIILLVLYILSLELLGFLLSSIIFISLLNILFLPERNLKSVIKSVAISLIASLILWYLFGYVFNITLP